jgi:hypothetical protein
MTASALSISGAAAASKEASKPDSVRELEEMSAVMVEERGLLNPPQAAILLEVSRERVYELMELGKLKRYEFTGRIYLSFAEVQKRREEDIKAGRPRRNVLGRAALGLKAAAKTDKTQAKQGGFAGPYEKAKQKRKK